jgi:hypothetical protein
LHDPHDLGHDFIGDVEGVDEHAVFRRQPARMVTKELRESGDARV